MNKQALTIAAAVTLLAGAGVIAQPAPSQPAPPPAATATSPASPGTNQAPAALPGQPPAAPGTNAASLREDAAAPAQASPRNDQSTQTAPVGAQADQAGGTNTVASVPEEPQEPLPPGMMRLNFRGAALETVLDYFSEAAGYIINLQVTPRGRVDVWSSTPVSKEEALTLLDSVLRKNGYAAIRNARTLTIVNRDEAKIHDIPVKLGADPEQIPRDDQVVTQILPVRFVEVTALVRDLQPLVSVNTTITANEAGNSIIITDTQANIRRVAEIIKAIDSGAEDVTEVRVFRLTNSDPTEVADLLTSLFPDESRSGGGNSSPVQFGMARFFGGGRGGPPQMGGGGGGSNSQSQRIRKRARVLAVPDPRTSSLVVSAARDLIPQIEAVVQELDSSDARKQTVHMYKLSNADPNEVQQVLQDMFERNSTSANRNSQNNNSTLLNRRNSQNNTGSQQNRTGNRIGGQGGMGTGGFGR